MCPECRREINDAEIKLIEKGHKSTDAGRIISELNFGFWTRLFSKHYQVSLWNNKTFLLRVFPHATNIQRTRHNLAYRVQGIRNLRNRVFHHQPILSSNLQDRYNEIIELFEWIDPTLVKANAVMCLFPTVYTTEYFDELKQKISEEFKDQTPKM